MFERPKFKIIYSNEVIEFLNSLENKVKEKIMNLTSTRVNML